MVSGLFSRPTTHLTSLQEDKVYGIRFILSPYHSSDQSSRRQSVWYPVYSLALPLIWPVFKKTKCMVSGLFSRPTTHLTSLQEDKVYGIRFILSAYHSSDQSSRRQSVWYPVYSLGLPLIWPVFKKTKCMVSGLFSRPTTHLTSLQEDKVYGIRFILSAYHSSDQSSRRQSVWYPVYSLGLPLIWPVFKKTKCMVSGLFSRPTTHLTSLQEDKVYGSRVILSAYHSSDQSSRRQSVWYPVYSLALPLIWPVFKKTKCMVAGLFSRPTTHLTSLQEDKVYGSRFILSPYHSSDQSSRRQTYGSRCILSTDNPSGLFNIASPCQVFYSPGTSWLFTDFQSRNIAVHNLLWNILTCSTTPV